MSGQNEYRAHEAPHGGQKPAALIAGTSFSEKLLHAWIGALRTAGGMCPAAALGKGYGWRIGAVETARTGTEVHWMR